MSTEPDNMEESDDKKMEKNLLPRTLKGVGGHYYIDHPGLKYPDEVLYVAEGMNEQTGQPYEKCPIGYITTTEAGRMLRISNKSTRAKLQRLNARYCLVREGDQKVEICWRRADVVNAILKKGLGGLPLTGDMIDARETMTLLGVQRSSVFRYVQQGKLREHRCNVMTHRGLRIKLYYDREEVQRLAEHLATVRQYQQEINRCNSEYRDGIQQSAPRREAMPQREE